jgi:hypothetical protein
MRAFTVHMGVVEETAPQAIFKQRPPGLIRKVPGGKRAAVAEFVHCVYGAGGGMLFGALPTAAPPALGGAGLWPAALGSFELDSRRPWG